MKKISLPIIHLVSGTFSGEDLFDNIKTDDKGDSTIEITVRLPTIVDHEIVSENRSKIISSTVYLEGIMDSILTKHLFADSSSQKRFFLEEILYNSSFTFSFKKGLIMKINKSKNIISGKDEDTFNKLLFRIMDYRNAFAHGSIIYDGNKDYLLKYYKGGLIKDKLTDEYFVKLEGSFNDLNNFLQKILVAL